MKYRRIYINGATYFFTVVTFNRRKIFQSYQSILLLNEAMEYVVQRKPFQVLAYVILPDHIHYIWTLPEGSSDYSTRWRLIKSYFTREVCKDGRTSDVDSRKKKGEQDIWQRRFWEHLIRDETDLTRHIEYIHYNPVRHGLVDSANKWSYSSFMDYVQMGLYPLNWGASEKVWSGSESIE